MVWRPICQAIVASSPSEAAGTDVPAFVRKVGGEGLVGFVPNSLLLWGAVSVVLILVLRRSGYGRMLYAYGDNPVAMRLAGVRGWQLLTVTYVLCSLLAAIGGGKAGERYHRKVDRVAFVD